MSIEVNFDGVMFCGHVAELLLELARRRGWKDDPPGSCMEKAMVEVSLAGFREVERFGVKAWCQMNPVGSIDVDGEVGFVIA